MMENISILDNKYSFFSRIFFLVNALNSVMNTNLIGQTLGSKRYNQNSANIDLLSYPLMEINREMWTWWDSKLFSPVDTNRIRKIGILVDIYSVFYRFYKHVNVLTCIDRPVDWGCRIYQLLLCRGVRPHLQQVSWIWH